MVISNPSRGRPRHYIAYVGLQRLSFGNGANGDVTIGDHADQAVVLAHRQCPRIDVSHQSGGVADAPVGAGDANVVGHCERIRNYPQRPFHRYNRVVPHAS
jgi:hypothetical protein